MTATSGIIVGGGAVGSNFHLPALLGILGCAEVTIVDRDPAQCAQLTARFGSDPRIVVADTVPTANFAIGVIATPPLYHPDCFDELLDKCARIIVEKPMAVAMTTAQDMVDRAAANNTELLVALIRRSMDNFSLARSWKDSKFFGELHEVAIAEGQIFNWNAVSLGSFSKRLNGGGVVMDTGPHTIDQVFQLFDTLSLQHAAMDALPAADSDAIEANAVIKLQADGRCPVTVSLSRNRALSNTAVLKFERAELTLGLHDNSIRLSDEDGNCLDGFPGAASARVEYEQLFRNFYAELVATGSSETIHGSRFLQVQAVLQDIYQAPDLLQEIF